MPSSDDKPDEPDQPLRGRLRKRSDASSRDADEVSVGKMTRISETPYPLGQPDEILMQAEDEVELASDIDRMHREQGKVDDRTLFSWMDRLRGTADMDETIRNLLVSAATLLLIRWLEAVEDEAAAIAEFEQSDYERCLHPNHALSRWLEIPKGRLSSYLETVVIPELAAARGSEYASYAHRLPVGLEAFSTLEPGVQTEIVGRVAVIDPSEIPGRFAGQRFLDSIFEGAGRQMKSGKGSWRGKVSLGELRTPHDLAWLMAKLVDPGPADKVYDPCFGSGTLLVEAAHRKRAKTSEVDSELWAQMQRNGIYGREIDPSSFLVGLASIVYEGVDLPRLELGDSLEADLTKGRTAEGFDCILANPPFSGRVPRTVGNIYPIPMAEGEGLFLQHIVDALRPRGRAVVLVPPSVLSNSGRLAKLRKFLIESNLVDQVIGLPSGWLQPYTTISPALLVLQKGRRKNTIRFSKLEAPAKRKGIRYSDLSDAEKDSWELLEWDEAKTDSWPEEFSYEQSLEEVSRREFDLRVREESSTRSELRVRELAERFSEVEICKLGELCEVIQGASYRRSETVETPEEAGHDPVGLLRISDMVKGEIRKPALFFQPDSRQLQRLRSQLEPGDLLLSTKGTIGKIAIVPELESKVVASSGIAILRPEAPTFLREYLFAILRSKVYREILTGLSAGSTLQHIRHSDIKSLPIPVPPIQIQDQISIETRDSESDAFLTLSRILEGNEQNLFFEWVEQDGALRNMIDSAVGRSKDRLRILEQAADSISEMKTLAGEQSGKLSMDVVGEFFPWLKALSEAAAPLRKITRIEDLSERFSLLSLARTRSMIFDFVLPEQRSVLSRQVDTVSKAFEHLISSECQSILKQQEVCADSFLPQNDNRPEKATIYFHNEGPLPLRDVRITDPVSGAGMSMSYWGVQTSVNLDVEDFPELLATVGKHRTLTFLVEAVQLDESDFFAECPAPIYLDEVADESESETKMNVADATSGSQNSVIGDSRDIGTSPYNAGSPVRNVSMLYGRDPILRLVQRQLSAKDRPNVILLEGNRRTGKTSILRRIEGGDLLPDWVVAYCTFQGAEGSKEAGLQTAEIWRLIAKEIGLRLFQEGYEAPLPGDIEVDPNKKLKPQFMRACRKAFKEDYPFEIFEEFLQECLERIKPKRLVLMLDEFDKLQEGIDSGVTSPQVPENIRYLIHEYPDFCAILTGSRRLKRLREEYWSALFGFGHREGVSALRHKDALALVTEPVEGQLEYNTDAAEEIVAVTAGQPFLIQSLCNRVFEEAAESGKRRVDLRMVRKSIDRFVDGSEHFRHFWGCAETERRKLILYLIRRGETDSESTAMTLPLLEETLAELKVPIPRNEKVGDDLAFLRDFEMIRLKDKPPNQHYSIEIPLFGRWITEQEDFDETVQKAIEEGEKARL